MKEREMKLKPKENVIRYTAPCLFHYFDSPRERNLEKIGNEKERQRERERGRMNE